ncbi:Oidioi.mRNA.OKI2018_I69.chr1.g1833.t1.cds [Oikopleura dioica]|uniref:Oidioi.mRNA.OKI2018_I69.chr1.g1833.t1.cds n=1 Tax=Oikopleura dioica TaxID=34765 RepID=A0ABN7SU66_OIKDI|nr:Oidioi.mRNA.OKI2018_I69.chr1.g1833.t1.cds [Oikopleura dioica]
MRDLLDQKTFGSDHEVTNPFSFIAHAKKYLDQHSVNFEEDESGNICCSSWMLGSERIPLFGLTIFKANGLLRRKSTDAKYRSVEKKFGTWDLSDLRVEELAKKSTS